MSTPAKVSIAVENGAERLNALDWRRIAQELDNQGSVVLERLASADECRLSPRCTLRMSSSAAAL